MHYLQQQQQQQQQHQQQQQQQQQLSLVPVSTSNALAVPNDPGTVSSSRALQAIRPYVIANLDPYAIDRAARLHRSAAGNKLLSALSSACDFKSFLQTV